MTKQRTNGSETPLRVLVPAVAHGAQGPSGGLASFWSQPARAETLENRKALTAVDFSLLGSGLASRGRTAVAALDDLHLAPPRWALWQRLRPGLRPLWSGRELLCGGDPVTGEMAPSAELGMALALARDLLPRRHRVLFATGALSDPPAAGAPLDNQAQVVRPIGYLREKLRYVLSRDEAELDRHRPPGGTLLFFTPMTCTDAGQVLSVQDLDEVAALARRGVKVIPVRTLDEALRHLGASHTRMLPADWAALAAVALFGVGTGVGWPWYHWQGSPIQLEKGFGGPAAALASPYLQCPAGTASVALPLKRDRNGLAELPRNNLVGWTIRVGEADSRDARLMSWFEPEGYYLAFGLFCDQSPPGIQLALRADGKLSVDDKQSAGDKPLRVAPGGTWNWQSRLSDDCRLAGLADHANPTGTDEGSARPTDCPAGETVHLVLLASRRPIDQVAINAALQKVAQLPASSCWSMNNALAWLRGRFPGALVSDLRVVDVEQDPCEEVYQRIDRVSGPDATGCNTLWIENENAPGRDLQVRVRAGPPDGLSHLYAYGVMEQPAGGPSDCIDPGKGLIKPLPPDPGGAESAPGRFILPDFFARPARLCLAATARPDPALADLGLDLPNPPLLPTPLNVLADSYRSDVPQHGPQAPHVLLLEPVAEGSSVGTVDGARVMCRAWSPR